MIWPWAVVCILLLALPVYRLVDFLRDLRRTREEERQS